MQDKTSEELGRELYLMTRGYIPLDLKRAREIVDTGMSLDQIFDGYNAYWMVAQKVHQKEMAYLPLLEMFIEKKANAFIKNYSAFDYISSTPEALRLYSKYNLPSFDRWEMQSDDVIAHLVQLPKIDVSITDIFNFKSGERQHITRDLAGNIVKASDPQALSDIPDALFDEAKSAFESATGRPAPDVGRQRTFGKLNNLSLGKKP